MISSDVHVTEARRLPEESVLRLTWSDGHSGDFDYRYLRGWCPCAGCQGHGGTSIVFRPPAGAVTADIIEPVGNYALSILWSDGHGTGIYRFDFLRTICPCSECGGAKRIDL
ncbi:MAG: DUF971 domain-containing protein [Acidobacteriota bacterium]